MGVQLFKKCLQRYFYIHTLKQHYTLNPVKKTIYIFSLKANLSEAISAQGSAAVTGD